MKQQATTRLLIDFSFSEFNKSIYAILFTYNEVEFFDYQDNRARVKMPKNECERLKAELMTTAQIETEIQESRFSKDHEISYYAHFEIKAKIKFFPNEYIGMDIN